MLRLLTYFHVWGRGTDLDHPKRCSILELVKGCAKASLCPVLHGRGPREQLIPQNERQLDEVLKPYGRVWHAGAAQI